MIQENEEDNALEMGTAEISDLLGEKEHLYQKILYLVMADSAYCEGGFLSSFCRNIFYSVVYSNKHWSKSVKSRTFWSSQTLQKVSAEINNYHYN